MNVSSWKEQAARAPLALLPLLRDLGNLKRIRSAGRLGTIAERLFATAWARLVAGQHEAEVACSTVLAALVATRLGDIDAHVLTAAGVPEEAVSSIRRDAANDASRTIDPGLQARLRDVREAHASPSEPPPFVARLAAQPRAGATSPGRGRLILEPPENHAEHCALVAIYGTLLAPAWGARPEDVFLAGLAHHLHNALLPDSGYAGEVLLGDWLAPVIATATSLALRELPAALRDRVAAAARILPDATTPEGRAFHAADTLDRVLQLEHHLRAASTSMDYVLNDMALVHAGPVKPFQDAVLFHMGLAT